MFYKLLENQSLTFGPCVISAEYELLTEFKDSYTYPVDGWYWFDTLEEANAYFTPNE
jgi:hypothetical protein